MLTQDRLHAVTEATWPPRSVSISGPFTIRDGAGGGKRVSAATLTGPFTAPDIEKAAAEMRALGQTPLFQPRASEADLDAALAAAGYDVIDPVVAYVAPVSALIRPDLPRLAAIPCDAPLAIQAEIWAEGGIGPARLAVMARAAEPRSYLLGRAADRPAGTAFVSIHEGVAMIHAIEVLTTARRKGIGRNLVHGAANWAAKNGAELVALLVTRANTGANALYASLGMEAVEGYHYRIASG